MDHGTAKEFEGAFFGLDSGSIAEATQELRLGVRGQIRGLHERGVKDRAKERDRSSAGSTRASGFREDSCWDGLKASIQTLCGKNL